MTGESLSSDWIRPGQSLAIVAGHYCVSKDLEELSSIGAPEEASFIAGVQFLVDAQKHGARAQLTVWINDIGIPSEERAQLKKTPALPENYRRILQAAGIEPSTISIQFESSTRNKASTHVKRLSAKDPQLFRRIPSDAEGLVRCIETCGVEENQSKMAYVIDGPEGEALVVKDGPHPKCNMILATLFDDVTKAARADTVVTVFNGIYVNRIRLGMHVAQRLLGQAVSFEGFFTFDDHSCQRTSDGKRYRIKRAVSDSPVLAP